MLSGSFRLFAALLYAPFLLLAFTPPTLLTVVGGVFNALLTFLVTKAVKRGDLSLVSPIYAFTPIITFVISWLLLGEAATLWALLGIVLVVVGSFILNIKHGWNALTRLFTHAGTRTMFMAAVVGGLSSVIDKVGVSEVGVVGWAFYVNAISSLILLGIKKKVYVKEGVSIGMSEALSAALQLNALQFLNVAYVIAIKRFNTVIIVLLSKVLFKEHIKERLVGAVLITVGVILVSVMR